MGYSRAKFYEILRKYLAYGSQGLLDMLPGPRPPTPIA